MKDTVEIGHSTKFDLILLGLTEKKKSIQTSLILRLRPPKTI